MAEERRSNIRTLVIASLASAVAALVTSQFWIRGTPIAAALTPVIVALVSELLHHPTEKLAQRFTAETDALPEAAAAAPPPPEQETAPSVAPDPQMRVYRPGRRLRWGVIAATAAAAFVIGAAVLTLPELIAGGALGQSGRDTTLFGGKSGKPAPATETQTVTTPAAPVRTVQRTVPAKAPAQTAPKRTTTTRAPPAATTPRTTTSTAP